MKMRKKNFILLILILIAVKTINAEEVSSETIDFLGFVIVTATKTERSQATVGSSTTVITSQVLEKTGSRVVIDALRSVPAVSVVQSGAFSGATYVYLRGSEPGHTLVLIDGIEVNDPIQADASFEYGFAHLTTDNIERIEIVRGPQSTLYGSDAMGGVINIITKKGKGKPKCEALYEGGSYNTFKEKLGFSGSQDRLNYSLSFSRLDSDGISNTVGTSEDDSYKNTSLSARLGYEVFENADIDFVLRFTDAQYDSDDGAYQDDPNRKGWWRNIAGKFAFDQVINSIWDHKLSYSYSHTKREYEDEPDSIDAGDNTHNWFKSNLMKLEWQHNISPVDWDILTCGFEYQKERGFADGRRTLDRLDRQAVDNKGYYLQNQFKFWENFFITQGLRMDEHELFGTEDTYKISTAYLIPQIGTRLKANWGTGFKAPSLYQLYHPTYGDVNLTPEESKSYDFGIEQSFLDSNLSLGLVYFHNDFGNLIEYNSALEKYESVGKAETNGVELELGLKPIESFKIELNYTYTDTENRDTGNKLRRRPQNQTGLDINWLFFEKLNINLNTKYIGHNWDDSANTQKVKHYAKIDLSIYYDLPKDFQIFGRVENLLDREYQEKRGYATAGRSFYAGGKATF